MGKHRPVSVGDKFISKDGVWVTVTMYNDANNVEVCDGDGNKRVTDMHTLWGGIKWKNIDGSVVKSRRTMASRGSGTPRQKMLDKLRIGSVWVSRIYGDFTIVEVENSANVSVRWHSTGECQRGVLASSIYKGTLVNKTFEEIPSPYAPVGHYVYMATVDGYVVYIGRGKGNRYKHAYSGRSGNRELNRLYFNGAHVVVEVLRHEMTYEESCELEKKLIAKYKPLCNEVIYKV